MSRSWENPVLWSHYAEGHKGVCLGFDVKEELLEEVKYADELLKARLNDSDDPPTIPADLQQLLLVTKYVSRVIRMLCRILKPWSEKLLASQTTNESKLVTAATSRT
jgi:hypothetical protein